MVEMSDMEQKVSAVTKKFAQAWEEKDASKLRSTLADDVVMHEDGLSLGEDIKGADPLEASFKKGLFDKYDYSGKSIAQASCGVEKCGFIFWRAEDMVRKGSKHKPENIVGIDHILLDEDLKIKEIWCLRQMTIDQVESHTHTEQIESEKVQLRKRPAHWQRFPVDPLQWGEPAAFEHTKEHCSLQKKALDTYNGMWRTGDAAAATEVMASDLRMYNPVIGTATRVVEDFERMIETFSQRWKEESNRFRTACTHSDKGFLWWQATSTKKDIGLQDTMYGLSMLVFNRDSRVTDVITFRQPTEEESQDLVREQYQRDN